MSVPTSEWRIKKKNSCQNSTVLTAGLLDSWQVDIWTKTPPHANNGVHIEKFVWFFSMSTGLVFTPPWISRDQIGFFCMLFNFSSCGNTFWWNYFFFPGHFSPYHHIAGRVPLPENHQVLIRSQNLGGASQKYHTIPYVFSAWTLGRTIWYLGDTNARVQSSLI